MKKPTIYYETYIPLQVYDGKIVVPGSQGMIFTEKQADLDMGVQECVYRIWYGKKYIIWYGMNLYGSFFHFKKGYAHYDPEADQYHKKMYEYMFTHRKLELKVEILLETSNHYQILKQQQLYLNAAKHDKNCLNGLFWAYTPRFNKTTREFGSFKKHAILNYYKWIKSERYLKMVTGF